MIWDLLTPPWRACVEEAWAAYCMRSLPIGSVITDNYTRILVRERNRIHHEQVKKGNLISGHRLAHAEINALLQIDWNQVDPRTCTLYTTTEPCPLCIGAIRMITIGEVRYASRDEVAGSEDLLGASSFLRKAQIKIVGPEHSDLEILLIAMLVEFALGYVNAEESTRYAPLTEIDSEGASLGRRLFQEKLLQQWRYDERAAQFVLNQLAEYIS